MWSQTQNFSMSGFMAAMPQGWRSGNMQIQFNYDYSDAELSEWVDKMIMTMADQAKAGYLLFNNHVRGQAPRNAQSMVRILKQAGLMKR
jgi:uncharacterized protein YecE (DUF72 family)